MQLGRDKSKFICRYTLNIVRSLIFTLKWMHLNLYSLMSVNLTFPKSFSLTYYCNSSSIGISWLINELKRLNSADPLGTWYGHISNTKIWKTWNASTLLLREFYSKELRSLKIPLFPELTSRIWNPSSTSIKFSEIKLSPTLALSTTHHTYCYCYPTRSLISEGQPHILSSILLHPLF